MSMTGTVDRDRLGTEVRPVDEPTKREAEEHAKKLAWAMIQNVHRDPRFYLVSALKTARDAQGSQEANYLLDKFKAGHEILNDIPIEAKTHLDGLHRTLGVPGYPSNGPTQENRRY